MDFKIISHKDINIEKWDKLLHPIDAIESQYTTYSFITSASKKWSAFVLDDYVSAFPFVHENKMGYEKVFQPFFTRNFTFIGEINDEFINSVFHYLSQNFKYLNINLPYKLDYSFLNHKKFIYQKLDLNKSYKSLHNSFSKNTQRIINKSRNLLIEESSNLDGFIQLFKSTVGDKLNYKTANYSSLSSIIKNGILNKKINFLQIKNDHEVLGYAIFFIHKNVINFLKGAVNKNGRKLGAMYMLINHCILKNAGSSKQLDFGGSNISSVAEFYRKFGAVDVEYYNHYYDHLPSIFNKLKNIKSLLEK